MLDGVASVADVDRALATGPGLRWALMGQHMVYHLGGGEGGIEHFMEHIGASYPLLWKSLADWTAIPSGAREALMHGIREEMGDRKLPDVAAWRDAKIGTIYEGTSNMQLQTIAKYLRKDRIVNFKAVPRARAAIIGLGDDLFSLGWRGRG